LLVDIFLKEGVWSWFWFRTDFLVNRECGVEASWKIHAPDTQNE